MDIKNQSWETVDKAEFLETYWQKKPLFIKGAFPPDFFKFSGDHLAGLSLEPEAKSRIVQEKPNWSTWDGPFEADTFEKLPQSHWTLLVQEVDGWVDEVYQFRTHFDFIPRWRFDDVMVSYAAEQGGVGAHTDHYDVFLIQTFGSRKWRLESGPIKDDSFIPDLPIRILNTFEPGTEILAEPGDLLYIPPEWAHEGTAATKAMTWSVGFRSPSAKDAYRKLLEIAPNQSLATPDFSENVRFQDLHLKPRKDPYAICSEDLEALKVLLSDSVQDPKILSQTLGELVSESFRDSNSPISFYASQTSVAEIRKEVEERLQSQSVWALETSLRCFYFKHSLGIDLFVHGKTFSFGLSDLNLILDFCRTARYKRDTLKTILKSDIGVRLLSFLLDQELIS